ncbi:hypothetical protein GT354_14300, partial [Streptomyces sp. SID3343]|nr:hypothetical protein [Streptomyces sp. SID3343]
GLAGQGFTRARERVALFASPLALYGSAGRAGRPIGAEIADAANVLRDYRDLIRQTVGRGGGGFDADGRAWLDHVGVVVPEAPGLGTTSVASALFERTSAAFERPEGLLGFAERLRELADRIKPAPGSGRVDEVDRTCSDAVLARYARPAAFPIGPGHPGIVAGLVLGGFLTAFWPALGVLGAVLAVLLATASAALIAIRRPDREGRSALPPEVLSTIMVNGLAAAAGAVGGWFAGDAWGPPIGVGPLALVLGLGILAVLPGVDWMVRARTWEHTLALGGALQTLNALHGVLVRTVWNDWALAGPRREAVDRSTVLAALLEESAKVLTDDASAIERQLAGDLSASREPEPSP